MKILFILLFFTNFVFAYKVQGILKNTTQNTLSLQTNFDNNLIITILPQTTINIYGCGVFGNNKKQGNIQDLKKGSIVKVNGQKNGSIILAKEVLVECETRAY
ncbi:hypothetical protein IY971_02770 [Campylobacter volucris]|uniref:hypothetical protein n=2 Tax=Campylobacter volucris TaxID=1031542 RepID=UPI00105A5EF6|nr:hypothetical protein [Campylobacter volucris]MBF7042333.1 hypothetical protein [Campylobacter volucris]TDJ86114.1 hypothetical protein E2O24_05630 [Campylobacter volucris]